MLALKSFRRNLKGLPDLLNYAAEIEDGIILGKDGSLMAGWIYQGDDHASAMPAQRNALAAHVNSALGMLGSGWMTHHDCIRTPVAAYTPPEASHFPDPISRLIDEERRRLFDQHGRYYESQHLLFLTYLPPTTRKSKLGLYFYEDDGEGKKNSASLELEKFRSAIAELEGRLGSFFRMERLLGHPYRDEQDHVHIQDNLLSAIHRAVTGIDQRINLPAVPMYLDAVIGGQDFSAGISPKIGDRHIRLVSIDGFPQESYPGILDALDQVPISYRWNTRFIYLEGYEAEGELERYRKVWEQKERSFRDQMFNTQSGRVDLDARAMTGDALEAQAEAASGFVRYGYYTSVIVLSDEEPVTVERSAKQVMQIVRNLGFGARQETVNAVEAWLGTLPGHGVQNIRRPPLHTLNLAHMLPLSSVWAGEPVSPCPFYPANSPPLLYGATDGSTPWRLNLHVSDIGHTLMLGPTGSGKSTKLAMMMAQFLRYPRASIFAFDKGYSAFVLSKAVAGQHYDLGGDDSEISFAPLIALNDDRDIGWASRWVEMIADLQGVMVSAEHRKEIHRALKLMQGSDHRTMTALHATLQFNELKDAIEPYTIDGPFGRMFDAESDGLLDGHFQVFEMEHLMNLGEKAVLPALDYIFYRIERQLQGQPAMIAMDEAWVMFGHNAFREKIREWLKVLRKANCSVVMATQSLSDVDASGILDVINENCMTKIFLANPQAIEESASELYQRLGLNTTQIEIVSGMVPKRDYYYTSPLGRRRYRLELGPVALSFVGVSGKEEVAKAKQLITETGTEWPIHWMRSRGVEV